MLLTRQEHHRSIAEKFGQIADVFIYDDAIKALSNIPELRPDIHIVSIHDFPRHWKPLQIITEQQNTDSLFYLLADAPVHRSELKKIQAMNIAGLIESEDDGNFSNNPVYTQLIELIEKNNDADNLIQRTVEKKSESYKCTALVSVPGLIRLLPCELEISGKSARVLTGSDCQELLKKNQLLSISWEQDGSVFQSRALVDSGEKQLLSLL
ncbi:hypothetical protein [Spirochaeta dissipatitropha]